MTATIRAAAAEATRISSMDVVRGAVMVLMAIDHVRVYSGLPAGGSTAGIFFTRWVTHFCAPAFIFLAGTSAFMYARRHPDVSRFLVTRGLWLILLELTILRVAWTFNLEFGGYNMAGVIWVIGWCMVALALLVRFPLGAIAAFGLVIIAGHNLFDLIPGAGSALAESRLSGLWKIVYLGFSAGPIGSDGPQLWVLYSLVPWVGVIAAGYAFGAVLLLEPERRLRVCFGVGLGAIAAFVLLRGLNLYGDPRPWRSGPRRPQRDEVSGVPVLPVDDTRPDDRHHAATRAHAWSSRTLAHRVRTRPVLLLRSAHPADPRTRHAGLSYPNGRGQRLAVREPPDGAAATS